MMEFSCPTITGTLPSPRSWHASTVLPRQRIFVHGGYDGNQILTDSFVFDIGEFILYVLGKHEQFSMNSLYGNACTVKAPIIRHPQDQKMAGV